MTTDTDALIEEARKSAGDVKGYTGYRRRLLIRLADALAASRAEKSTLKRYRAATHWIGADNWDGCSDCMEHLRWATSYDLNRDMTPDEIALALKPFFAEHPRWPPPPNPAPLTVEDLATILRGQARGTPRTYAERAQAILSRIQAGEIKAEPAKEGWRPEVRAFADLMEAQLKANDHKPGWKDSPTWALYDRMREESTELLDAIQDRQLQDRSDHSASLLSPDVIGRKAANVANFAMMIADVSGAPPLRHPLAMGRKGDGV